MPMARDKARVGGRASTRKSHILVQTDAHNRKQEDQNILLHRCTYIEADNQWLSLILCDLNKFLTSIFRHSNRNIVWYITYKLLLFLLLALLLFCSY